MKSFTFLKWIVIGAALSSCTVFSVHPLYLQDDLIMDNRLQGTWKDIEDEDAFFQFKSFPDSSYVLSWWEKEDTIWYEAHYFQLGEYYFLDLYPTSGKWHVDDQLLRNYVPVHTFLKIELSDEKTVAHLFDGEKMMALFRQNRIRLNHELLDDYVLITARTEDLRKFIIKYSGSDEAFGDKITFIKIGE